ncbi:hypothetical protein [Clostridium algidicarnis]|uniref:hypothetical protein n=1 Tax=Clostridium algidicarnis TaxID=37659 RepID=UPI001C0B1E43|nr:hypothetical protein [Clostridium algidicarnis]MBU3228119.1 hypothetical protein [Clostridium algidicarnis]MBU3252003.1 hypothetical protein [Clostridium algidicarnis]
MGAHITYYPCISTDIDINFIDESRVSIYNRNDQKSYLIGHAEYVILSNSNGIKSIEDLSRLTSKYTQEQIEKLIINFKNMGFINSDDEKQRKKKNF